MPYSSATSIMTSRDHPFNQSSRPLLAERKTQFLVKKSNKFNSNHNNNHSSKSSARQLQTTDRESLKVHGINDFDLISQQYRTYNNHNMGYPYGSPPSPRSPVFETQKSDFLFNDGGGNNYQNHANNYYNSNVHNWQQLQQHQHTNHNGGPFIFGVHDNLHNNQLHNPHQHQPQDIYDSVINNSKYSLKSGLQTSLVRTLLLPLLCVCCV